MMIVRRVCEIAWKRHKKMLASFVALCGVGVITAALFIFMSLPAPFGFLSSESAKEATGPTDLEVYMAGICQQFAVAYEAHDCHYKMIGVIEPDQFDELDGMQVPQGSQVVLDHKYVGYEYALQVVIVDKDTGIIQIGTGMAVLLYDPETQIMVDMTNPVSLKLVNVLTPEVQAAATATAAAQAQATPPATPQSTS